MARSQGQWWIDTNYPPNMIGSCGIMTTDQQYNIEFNNLLSCAYQVIRFKLPESIDETYFKMCLFLAGKVAIFEDVKGDGKIRSLDCAMANKPDIYYMPSGVIIVNPTFAGYSYQLTPGKDVAVIYCREVDRYQYGLQTGGLFGLISTTAQLLADNTISINTAQKNMRLTNILSANDTMTKTSIDIVIKRMYEGSPYECVQSSLVDQLNSLPMTAQTNTQQLVQLLQTRQYIYAHFYEQIGLKTHDQMKKERLITSEIDEGTELAIFNVQDMIATIQKGIDEANRIFGLDIQMQLHPLIASTLDRPDEAEPAGEAAAAEPAGEFEIDAAADDLTASDPAQDFMQAIYQAAAQRVADMIRGKPAEDQSEADGSVDGEPEDDQTEAEPDDDQSDDAAADDQTDDAADDDQTEDEADDDQTDDAADDGEPAEAAQPISQTIVINVQTGDVSIEGGDADADNATESRESE